MNMKLKIERMEKENKYEKTFKEIIRQIRRKQHDYDNHINAIYAMALTTGSYEELMQKQREYWGDKINIEDKYGKIVNEKSSPVIIGFLFHKFTKANELGIDINPHIVIEEAECNISQCEMIEIIGILFDNAVEAVKDKEKSAKKIRVEIVEYKENIEIVVMNRSDYVKQSDIEMFFMEGYSTKGSGRGLGLSNVKKIVKKSKSRLIVENITVDGEQWFSVKIIVYKE